jgi:hypothetical protein
MEMQSQNNHMENQNNTPATPATATALVVWNDETAANVRALVKTGASVPKGLYKAAPKGFIAELREVRKHELITNSTAILGGFADKGFKLTSLTPIKTLKNGVQQVTLKLATPKPTAKMTLEEYASQEGTTVGDVLASLDMMKAPKAPAAPAKK